MVGRAGMPVSHQASNTCEILQLTTVGRCLEHIHVQQ